MADLADAAGRVVAVPLAALARVRRAKPMHPHGAVFPAVLRRQGIGVGIPWLDAVGTDDAAVRFSRGAGLPARFPDLLGLALRVAGDPPVDLLLSSAGRGRWTRRVPVLRRDAATPYGSVMAYRSAAGPVWLTALPQGGPLPSDAAGLAAAAPGRVVQLDAAVGRGPWRTFGTLLVGPVAGPLDPDLRFDAVLYPPPGLTTDGPMARFRRPAYAAARVARGAPRDAREPVPPSRRSGPDRK
ncbi:phosphodiesterase [Modestobacter versicolor]|uniref:phosphodiesterase n=1 Tax=Modestobacter versicolor TaxID=429133 RepID=UPI0034DF22A8